MDRTMYKMYNVHKWRGAGSIRRVEVVWSIKGGRRQEVSGIGWSMLEGGWSISRLEGGWSIRRVEGVWSIRRVEGVWSIRRVVGGWSIRRL